MAYENYSFVSWTEGTPITGERLQQMSTNTEQVKLATDGKPKGILRLKTVSSDSPSNTTSNANLAASYEVISLKNESGNPDNRITLETGRAYKLTLIFPGIEVNTTGGEDATYELGIKRGVFGNTTSNISVYQLNSGPIMFANVSTTAANNTNLSTLLNLHSGYHFGAGTYTAIVIGDGTANESFTVDIRKVAGPSGSNRATAYAVVGSEVPIQLMIEDIGSF